MKPDFEKWLNKKHGDNILAIHDTISDVHHVIEDINQFAEDYAKEDKIEWAYKIIKARDAFIEGDNSEVWHQLYSIASPNFDKKQVDVWTELEQLAKKYKQDES